MYLYNDHIYFFFPGLRIPREIKSSPIGEDLTVSAYADTVTIRSLRKYLRREKHMAHIKSHVKIRKSRNPCFVVSSPLTAGVFHIVL